MSILPEELKTFDYYKRKLPLYLQNSTSFQEHFKLWYDLMVGDSTTSVNGVVPTSDELLTLLDIFAEEYSDKDSISDILDKIGSIFGVTRNFSITYQYQGNTITEAVSLNDYEFTILIRSRIVRNTCEGTREQLTQFYTNVFETDSIIMKTSVNAIATCEMKLVFTTSQGDTLTTIQKLFLAGELRISSMGITYEEDIVVSDELLIFDNASHGWANADMISRWL